MGVVFSVADALLSEAEGFAEGAVVGALVGAVVGAVVGAATTVAVGVPTLVGPISPQSESVKITHFPPSSARHLPPATQDPYMFSQSEGIPVLVRVDVEP